MCAGETMEGLKMMVVRGPGAQYGAYYLWDTLWASSQYCWVDGHTSQDFKTYKPGGIGLLKCMQDLEISKECIEIETFQGESPGLEVENTVVRRTGSVLPWILTEKGVCKKPTMTKYIKSCQYTGWMRTEQWHGILSYGDYWWTWKNSHQEWR